MSLKNENKINIIGAIVLHGAFFVWIITIGLGISIEDRKWIWEIFRKAIVPGTLSFIGTLILSNILKGLIPYETQLILIHWRINNPLPGSRAFTKYARKDPRVDVNVLEAKYGPLPIEPSEQNTKWYSIYKSYEDYPGVRDSHKSYLLLRDVGIISFVLMFILPFAAYIITYDLQLVIQYFIILVLLFFVLSWAANTYAKRMVVNALAATM